MTWSIVARDPGGAFGIAVASRFFAVGALCPYVRSTTGAVCTQALVNPHYGPNGLSLLAKDTAPAEAIARLTGADEGREHRQLHMVDREGRTAAFTGGACIDWCGQRAGEGYSIAGNMLAGAAVLERTAAEYEKGKALPFAERLLAALAAGEAAGGDKRGKQAAALLICTTEDYPFLDIRVDDHAEPIEELRRLYRKSLERYQAFWRFLPSKDHAAGTTDRAVIEDAIARSQRS